MAGVRSGDGKGLDRSSRVGLQVEQDVHHSVPLRCSITKAIEHDNQIHVRFLVGFAPRPGPEHHHVREALAIGILQPLRCSVGDAQTFLWILSGCEILASKAWKELGHRLSVTVPADRAATIASVAPDGGE